jgi:hypothetical protein
MIDTTTNPFVGSLIEDTYLYCQADGKNMPDEVRGHATSLCFGEEVKMSSSRNA